MVTNKIKNYLKIYFNHIVRSGGQIASRREFYIVNLGQTVFNSEDEARKFVDEHEQELNEFFATLDPKYPNWQFSPFARITSAGGHLIAPVWDCRLILGGVT